MHIQVSINDNMYTADLSAPIDISLPLKNGGENPNCFYAPEPRFEPVRAGNFVGAVNEGGAVNFFNVQLNPHGNGTHTECVGHIAQEPYTINQCLKRFHFPARLLTVQPENINGDTVITPESLAKAAMPFSFFSEALVLRTLPNETAKRTKQYSGSNPPYLDAAAMKWIVEQGVEHLLVDLPSVDREQDNGVLAAHHLFWNYPARPRAQATITELVYIPDTVPDGFYLCNILIASLELDASPSKVLLFALS